MGEGEDLAILTFGNGTYLAHQARSRLAAEGIDARVIDIRWLSPLPEDAIVSAVGIPIEEFKNDPLLRQRLKEFRHHYGQPPEVRKAFAEAMGVAP